MNSSLRQALDAAQQQSAPIIRCATMAQGGSDMEFAAIQLFLAVALWILNTLQSGRP